MVDLDAIKRRLAKATPGPWVVTFDKNGSADFRAANGCSPVYADEFAQMDDTYEVRLCSPRADADLIAHAPTDLAALIAEVEALRAQLAPPTPTKPATWAAPVPSGVRRRLHAPPHVLACYHYDACRDAYHVQCGQTHTEVSTEAEAIRVIEAYAKKRGFTVTNAETARG